MTKGQLAEIIFDGDLSNIDFGIPKTWSDKIRELGIDPAPFVWSYKEDKLIGKPVNLYQEYAKIIIKKSVKIS